MTHRRRLIEVLGDGRWHRSVDICPTDRARKALQRLVRDGAGGVRYEASWTPVVGGRLRIVRVMPARADGW